MVISTTEKRRCLYCGKDKFFKYFDAGQRKCTECLLGRKKEKQSKLLNKREEVLDSYKFIETELIGLPIFTENKEQLTAKGRVEEHKGVKYFILPSRV